MCQEEPQYGLNLRLSSFCSFGEESEQDRDQCWKRAALLVPTGQPQTLSLEKLLMPSGDIDNAPRNSASVAILLPAAFLSISSQLASTIIIKFIHIFKTACTEMTLGPR